MSNEELLAEIEKHGGKVEPIMRSCRFKTSIEDNCIFRSKPATIPDEIGRLSGQIGHPLPGRLEGKVMSGAG